MSAKPPHRGHEAIINIAAAECDMVYLIVSLTDRSRPDEVIIEGKKVEFIWQNMMNLLPKNVLMIFTGPTACHIGGAQTIISAVQLEHEKFKLNVIKPEELLGPSNDTPVGWTWWLMSVFNMLHPAEQTFHVYVGPDDADRFPQDKITQYVGKDAPVKVKVIGENGRLYDVSGTQMREWLCHNNKESFIENLPTCLPQETKQGIWGLMTQDGVKLAPSKKIKNNGKKK